MPRIAVTFALRSEFAPWCRHGRFVQEGTSRLFRTRVGDSEICVLLTGVNCRSGESELRKLLTTSDVCIASGLAGGLTSQQPVGAVLVAETVKAENTREEFASDRQLVDIGLQCGAKRVSAFVTTSSIVNSSVEKRRLARMADAIDMETVQVFKQAREAGIPVVAARALSDNADDGIPLDLTPFINERGEINRMPAICEVMKSPHRIPQLIRFGVASSRAARNLAVFLDRYASMLANVKQSPVHV